MKALEMIEARREQASWLRDCRQSGASNKLLKRLKEKYRCPKPTTFDYLQRHPENLGGIEAVSGDREYWSRKWLLDISWVASSDEDIISALGIYSHYSGPGAPFRHDPYIERSNHGVLITQHGGLDI